MVKLLMKYLRATFDYKIEGELHEKMAYKMVFDAHVHVGYFPRNDGKGGEAYYWSPARVMQYMQWARTKTLFEYFLYHIYA